MALNEEWIERSPANVNVSGWYRAAQVQADALEIWRPEARPLLPRVGQWLSKTSTLATERRGGPWQVGG